MSESPAPEQGLYIASCFVHSLLLVAASYHLGLAHKAASRYSYDAHKHIIFSLRVAFGLWLTVVPLVELFYQLRWHLYPHNHTVLFYTEKVLQILAWSGATVCHLWVARKNSWLNWRFLDHLLQLVAWIFVFIIQALRTAEYRRTPALTEQYTTIIVLTFGGLYGLTLVAFHVVDILRRQGRCGAAETSEVTPVLPAIIETQ